MGSTFVREPSFPPSLGAPTVNSNYYAFNPFSSNLASLQANTIFSAPDVKNIVTTALTVVEDYLPWRTQFEVVLISNSLLGMIDRTILMPPMYAYDPISREIVNSNYFTWLKIDQTVRSWLFATLSKELFVEGHNLTFSTLIWERFQNMF